MKRVHAIGGWIHGPRQRHRRGEHTGRPEPPIARKQSGKAAKEQARAHQQHEREGDGEDDERALHPVTLMTSRPRGALLQRLAWLPPLGCERRNERDEQRRDQRHGGGERQHSKVNRHLVQAGHALGND